MSAESKALQRLLKRRAELTHGLARQIGEMASQARFLADDVERYLEHPSEHNRRWLEETVQKTRDLADVVMESGAREREPKPTPSTDPVTLAH